VNLSVLFEGCFSDIGQIDVCSFVTFLLNVEKLSYMVTCISELRETYNLNYLSIVYIQDGSHLVVALQMITNQRHH